MLGVPIEVLASSNRGMADPPRKEKFGPCFKKDSKTVKAAVEVLSQGLREKLALGLQTNGKIELGRDLINTEKRTRVENVRDYTPNVIGPSFEMAESCIV